MLIRKVFFILFLTAITVNVFSQTAELFESSAEEPSKSSAVTIFNQASENYTSSIKIITNKDGADVFFDGELKGKTPITIENIAQGFHLIQIEKENFVTNRFQITVNTYSNQQIIIELQKVNSDKKTVAATTEGSATIDASSIGDEIIKTTNSETTNNSDKEKNLFVTTSGTFNGCIQNFVNQKNTLRQMQISVGAIYKINSMFNIHASLTPQFSFIADDMSDGASFSFSTGLELLKTFSENFSLLLNASYCAEINDALYSLFLYSPNQITGLSFTTDFSWNNKKILDSNKNLRSNYFSFSLSPGIIYGGSSGFFKNSVFISQTKISASWEDNSLFIGINANCNQNLQNFLQWRLQCGALAEYKILNQDLSLGLKNDYTLTGSSRGKEFLGYSISLFCTVSN